MTSDPRSPFKLWTRWALALVPVALLLAALHYSDALTRLPVALSRVSLSSWVLAIAGQTLSYAMRAERLRASDPPRYRGRFGTCLRLILVNNALNLALPLRTGEVSFPLLLRRWFGTDLAQATGTLIWMRLLDLQILALAALLSFGLLDIGVKAGGWWQAAMLALLPSPLLLWLALPWLMGRNEATRSGLLYRVLAGLPASGRVLFVAWCWTIASWGIKLLALGQLLAGLAGIKKPLAALGAVGADLSTVLPLHSPGGFGSFEAGILAFISVDRSPNAGLLAAALSFHLFVLGFALLAGIVAWSWPAPSKAEGQTLT